MKQHDHLQGKVYSWWNKQNYDEKYLRIFCSKLKQAVSDEQADEDRMDKGEKQKAIIEGSYSQQKNFYLIYGFMYILKKENQILH